jgi:hypothetical protein
MWSLGRALRPTHVRKLCGVLDVLDPIEPFRQPVPSGESLVHHLQVVACHVISGFHVEKCRVHYSNYSVMSNVEDVVPFVNGG